MKMRSFGLWIAVFFMTSASNLLCLESEEEEIEFLDDDPEALAGIAKAEKEIGEYFAEIDRLDEKNFRDRAKWYEKIVEIGDAFYQPESFKNLETQKRVRAILDRSAQANEDLENISLDKDPVVMQNIATMEQQIKDIASLDDQGKFVEALSLYNKLVDSVVYLPHEFEDSATAARVEKINERRYQVPKKAAEEAERLENAGKIEDALKLYWLAPARFAKKIWALKKPIIKDYLAQAKSSESRGNIPQALDFYRKASVELEAIFDDTKEMMEDNYGSTEGMEDFGLTDEERKEAEDMREEARSKIDQLDGNAGKPGDLLQALNNLTSALGQVTVTLK